mgnify:CR=1 FL=1
MVIYSDRLVPDRFAAVTFGPISFIRNEYRDDAPLHTHEAVHRRQFWCNPVMHGVLYFMSSNYRLDAELEAYGKQADLAPEHFEKYVDFIMAKYRMPESVTRESVRRRLLASDGSVWFEAIVCNLGIALCLSGLLTV